MAYAELAKFNCIHSQLLPLQVVDTTVLDALCAVPREKFVPEEMMENAYMDGDIPIGSGRYMLSVMLFARLVCALGIKESDVILDVGCGTGYSTAVLSQLAGQVIAVEERRDLANKTRQNLKDMEKGSGSGGATEVLTTTLAGGCTLMSPYDVIMFEGGAEVIPSSFFERLADGGRMAVVEMLPPHPSGSNTGMGKGVLYSKAGNTVTRRELFEASAHILPGFEKKMEFTF